MKSKLFTGFLFLLFLYACGNDADMAAENDVDAARNFIRASLDKNFEKARKYMLRDSLNNQYMDAVERTRMHMDREENRNYKQATIRIHESRTLNDNESIISYSNSYKKQKDSVKVVRVNNEWLVDFKFSFEGNKPK